MILNKENEIQYMADAQVGKNLLIPE